MTVMFDRRGLAAGSLLSGIVLAAYLNSLQGVFLFDDQYHIVENERIRRLWPIAPLLAVERPLVEISLAVNYAIAGLNPLGFHVFNLAVHTLAALTLFAVVRRTLQSHGFDEATRLRSTGLAWMIAALWAVHPLTTQSVTYVIQRGESMMGLFYLLTLYCAIRALNSPRRTMWHAAAASACALGMASKAVMVTAPLMVVLYDHVFLRGELKAAMRRRWGLYLGLAATWGVLWLTGLTGKVFAPGATGANVGFGYREVTPLQYLLTQPGVILWYLRLSFWPVGLCLDYDWPMNPATSDVLLPAILVAGLLAGTVWGLARRRPIGFAGAWFFGILVPTSSFIPIEDAIFEHRMYLPLAAVVAVVVLSVHGAARTMLDARGAKLAVAGVACLVLLTLGYATRQRNALYGSDLAMWGDVVAKRPSNARAHVAMGNALLSRERVDEAIASFRRAVELRPDDADAHVSLGSGLARVGALREAIAEYGEGLRLEPNHAKGWYNLGNALGREGLVDEAIESFQRSLLIHPSFADAHCNLGNALGRRGRLDEAIAEYHRAIELDPAMAKAHNNLGDAWRQLGRLDEAIAAFRQAIVAQPDYANAHANLAAAYLERGEFEPASRHAREALRIDARHPTAGGILNDAAKELSRSKGG